MSVLRSWVLCGLVVVGLAACGGGGGGGGGNNNGGSGTGSSGGDSTSGEGSTTTAIAPRIHHQPASVSVGDGSSAFFIVGYDGSSPLSVQWKKNGEAISCGGGPSCDINAVTLADNGSQITVTISNAAGSVTSNPATLSVYAVGPTIVTAPQTQTILAGTTATFSAVATGTPPLTFQWRKNGALIPGATSAAYTTPAATPLYDGSIYDVIVTNTVAISTSSPATLHVTPIPNAVSLNTQPVSVSANEGSIATFSVAPTGTGPFAYQWFKNGVAIQGGYQSTFDVAPATALDNGAQFHVEVSNSVGVAVSNPATLTVTSGAISHLLGRLGAWGNINGPAKLAQFAEICGLTADAAGNYYLTDGINHTVRKISSLSVVSVLAGQTQQYGYADGTGGTARFDGLGAITLDTASNLYVVDTRNQTVRKITPAGVVTTLAGTPGISGAADGIGSSARFNFPENFVFSCPSSAQSGIVADNAGNIFVADTNNHAIRKITPSGIVTTLAGLLGQEGFADGPSATARFNHPTGLGIDSAQNLYVLDRSGKIRKITPTGDVVSLPGNVFGLDGALLVNAQDEIFFTSFWQVYKYNSTGVHTLFAGNPSSMRAENGIEADASFRSTAALAASPNGDIVVADIFGLRVINTYHQVSTFAGNLGPQFGYADGPASIAQTRGIWGIVTDNAGNLYFADWGNHSIRTLSTTGTVTTMAGAYQQAANMDGTLSTARFKNPSGIARDSLGNFYISDEASHTVRKIASDGSVSTIAGIPDSAGFADGATGTSKLNTPEAVAVDSNGNIYVVDKNNFVVRKISPAGITSTLAGAPGISGAADGTGNVARFSNLSHIAVDSSDNLYVSDNYSIRKITPAGVVTTFAGSLSTFGTSDGTGSAAQFSFPHGIAIDASDNLYVADGGNIGTIRKITPTAVVSTVVGSAGVWGTQLGALPGSLANPQTVAVAPSVSGTKLVVSDTYSLILITLP